MPDERLSSAQLAAVSHETGAMLLLASPGSGKTFTLVRRVLQLITKGRVPPDRILVLTFTKAAALEMQSRFLSLTDGAYRETVFGTFHAVYYHILRSIPVYRNFHLATPKQQTEAVKEILDRHKNWPVHKDALTVQTLLEEISSYRKWNAMSGTAAAEKRRPARLQPAAAESPETVQLQPAAAEGTETRLLPAALIGKLTEEYGELCRFHGWLDFDDLILCSLEALRQQEAVRRHWQQRFTHILVDEFQDISPLQYEVLKLLACPQDNLFAVGDDDQSIYGFRGAAPSVMRRFLRDFPGAVQVEMSENFRSAQAVVQAADCVIRENRDRFEKHMRAVSDRRGVVKLTAFGSREEEERWLCSRLAGRDALQLDDTAVIVRTHALAGSLAEHFVQQRIPFVCREPLKSFYEQQDVQDVLAYLRFAGGEQERGLFLRIMNRPVRYLERELLDEPAVSLEKLRISSRNKPYLQEILRKLEIDLARLANLPPRKAVAYVRQRIGYDGWLRDNCSTVEEWEARKKILKEMEERAGSFDSTDRWVAHVRDCISFAQAGRKGENGKKRGVHLMTMHASKGLEFHTVYLPGLNEGTMPYRKAVTLSALEEERRLFYVGMTRAKEELYLSCQKTGPEAVRPPSRFLRPLFNLPLPP